MYNVYAWAAVTMLIVDIISVSEIVLIAHGVCSFVTWDRSKSALQYCALAKHHVFLFSTYADDNDEDKRKYSTVVAVWWWRSVGRSVMRVRKLRVAYMPADAIAASVRMH